MTLTRSLLAAAVALALSAGASANEQPATPPAQAATPAPTSSTADNNTAQRTMEKPTAQSFESTTAANATSEDAAAGIAPAPITATPTFDALDTNKDGFIARDELPAGHGLVAAWAQYDADNDARIARVDFDRYAATLRPMFLDLDTDRDGFIARTELPAGHALVGTFAEYDEDRDEKLARGDFDRWLDATHPDFASLDRNTDGALTRAELPSAHVLYTDFARFDTDSNGRLSKVEFDAFGQPASPAPVASAAAPEADEEETEEAE
jgi:Ca2+-binding EF-hand superfamily protein